MDNQIITKDEKKWVGLLNLLVVYVVWGSTYLAIRVAVNNDGGFAPFILGFTAYSQLVVCWCYGVYYEVIVLNQLATNPSLYSFQVC